jgi:hypothetical protein
MGRCEAREVSACLVCLSKRVPLKITVEEGLNLAAVPRQNQCILDSSLA